MGMYKGKTAEQWRKMAGDCHRRAHESFDRCDTDGFMSQWAATNTAQEYMMCAELAEQDGKADFIAVFDLDGNLMDARHVKGKYGWVWAIQLASGRTAWFNESEARKGARRLAADEKKGWRLGSMRTDAYVKTVSGGAWQVSYVMAPRDGTPREVIDDGTGGTWYADYK